MIDFQIDEKILNVFSKYIDIGIGKLGTDILIIMSIFAVFDLWISLTSVMSSTVEALKVLTRKVFIYGFWFALLKNYSFFTNMLYTVFTNIGKAFYPESSATNETILSVDKLAGKGFEQIGRILKAAISFNNINSLGWNLFYLGIFVLCLIFFVRAISELVVSIVQFKLISGISLIVLGFITLEFTKDIGFKAITGIIYVGLKIVVIYALLGIGFTVIGEFPIPEIKPEFNYVFDMALWSVLFVIVTFLASESESITNLIMHGNAGLSGIGLGTHIASGIKTTATMAAIAVGTIATVGTGIAAGAAAAGTGATSGSNISSIFKGAVKGGMEGFKKSKVYRDGINNTGYMGSKTAAKMTGGSSDAKWRNMNFRFRKGNKEEESEE